MILSGWTGAKSCSALLTIFADLLFYSKCNGKFLQNVQMVRWSNLLFLGEHSHCEENALKGPRRETKTVRGHLEKEEKGEVFKYMVKICWDLPYSGLATYWQSRCGIYPRMNCFVTKPLNGLRCHLWDGEGCGGILRGLCWAHWKDCDDSEKEAELENICLKTLLIFWIFPIFYQISGVGEISEQWLSHFYQ